MTKPWQIWLVLIAIFSTGIAGGWLVERHIARRQVQRPPPPEVWIARQIERITGEVQLTPEQKERIKPIVAANIDQLIKLRRQAIDILDQMGKQIAAELTPEQRARYEKILQARREAREMRGSRHRPDGAPSGGGEPPPGPDDRPPSPPTPEKSEGT
jgi:Spy/CpxP family protein refolding chaperone